MEGTEIEEYGDEDDGDMQRAAMSTSRRSPVSNESNKDDHFDPEFKKTSLSYEQKAALSTGLKSWDTKFQKILDKRNHDIEEKVPKKK